MPPQVRFSVSKLGADRIHHVTEADVRLVLSRIPAELWDRLRAVHFNDQSRGPRTLGYVDRERRDIALCALPPRMGLTRALRGGQIPEIFGARLGRSWPALAIRRFMLYNVFLHEVGHLQLIDEKSTSRRLKYANEKLAQAFAVEWRRKLWSEPFDHPDPVHNPPSPDELSAIAAQSQSAHTR